MFNPQTKDEKFLIKYEKIPLLEPEFECDPGTDPWGVNYLQDLERIEKVYKHIRHQTDDVAKLFFKCVRNEDFTEFYLVYKKAVEAQKNAEKTNVSSKCIIS